MVKAETGKWNPRKNRVADNLSCRRNDRSSVFHLRNGTERSKKRQSALFANCALIGYHLFKSECVNSRNVYAG
jgi:hypothetical protein